MLPMMFCPSVPSRFVRNSVGNAEGATIHWWGTFYARYYPAADKRTSPARPATSAKMPFPDL